MHRLDHFEGSSNDGLTKEEEEALTPLLTQLVQEATKSRSDKVKVNVTYRDAKSLPLLLNRPPTLAEFNRQIKMRHGSSLTITTYNAKKNETMDVDTDALLNMVIRKYDERGKIPIFTLADKNILEPNSQNSFDFIDHPYCQPGPSKVSRRVFLPRVVRLLGSGATAKVELIRCSKTGALYAMKKFVNKDGRKAAREVEAFTTIKSRRLVSLIKAFNEGDYVKLIMEYMPGGSLFSVISEGNKSNMSPPLSWDLIEKYTRELLEGINDIHKAGYVHMDIKPLNLVIGIDGSLKITDFGSFTKIGSEDYSCELTIMYASPEAIGKNSPWNGSCDMWSVGVTVLEMILGRVPWAHVSNMSLHVFSMMDDIIERELHGISLPWPIREILEKTLVIDPAKRSNASELLSLFETEESSSL